MAIGDNSVINGVTKYDFSSTLVYLFDLATIIVDGGDITFDLTKSNEESYSIPFADIVDQKGAANAEQYVDQLATDGHYRVTVNTSGGGGGSSNVTVVGDTVGLAKEAKQDTANSSLASIDGKLSSQATSIGQTKQKTTLNALYEELREIKYLLQQISE